MNSSQKEPSSMSASFLSDPKSVLKASTIATFVLFVIAALISSAPLDREILTLVRFISVLMLAVGIYTALMADKHLAYSRNRRLTGQVAAGCIGLAGGFVWSASSYGAGFIFFMIGTLLCALLIFKEMERHTNRRLERQKAGRESAES